MDGPFDTSHPTSRRMRRRDNWRSATESGMALAFRHNVGGKRGPTALGSYDVLHLASGFCGNHHTGFTALHANSFLPPVRHRSPATSPHDPWHGRSSFEFEPGGSEAAAVVNRIYFVECHGNGSSTLHSTDDPKMGLRVQYIHGMTSCSEWTGVPLSVLLNEAGMQKGASWLVSEGRTRASSVTRFRWLRPWTTSSWPTLKMASRSARAATQLHVGRVDEKGFSGGRSSM